MQVRSAVIPAAGMGTRFLPASKAVPKELLPIGDTPALQLVIVTTAEINDHEPIFELIEQYIVPAAQTTPPSENRRDASSIGSGARDIDPG